MQRSWQCERETLIICRKDDSTFVVKTYPRTRYSRESAVTREKEQKKWKTNILSWHRVSHVIEWRRIVTAEKKNEYKGTLDFWLDSASTLCIMCVYVIKIKAKFHWTWESWARNLNLFRYDDPRSSCVLGIFHTFSFPRLPPRPLALSLVCESSNVVFFCSLLSDSQTALRLSQWRINGLLEWTDRLLECGTHIGYRTSAKKR